MSSYDVAIIGAGIVGAACANEAAAAGLSVIVIDRGCAGGGATGAGMGHLVVMDDSDAQFALTNYSRELWRQMSDRLPAVCEYERSGTIWVAADNDEMDEVLRKNRYYSERGVTTRILDRLALNEAEPNLRDGLAGGLLVPDDAVLYPPCAADFLLKQAKQIAGNGKFELKHGVVAELSEDGPQLADDTIINAGITINCAGSWSSLIQSGLKVQPRKGHLVITDRYPGFVKHQLVELGYLKSAHSVTEDSVAFNVQPRLTGQLLIGSSRQFGDETVDVKRSILQRMLKRAVEYIPDLLGLSAIRSWTGFRAATPDKLPLISPVPGQARQYLATGHEGLGITTSLGTARLLFDQILNRNSAIDFKPYLPERFDSQRNYADV